MQVTNESSDDEDGTSEKKTNQNKVNGGLNNDTGSKQHKKHPAQKPLSKKDKKMQRMALMAEGFDSVVFSNVNDEALNGMEPSDEEMDVSSNDSSSVNGIVEPNVISSSKRKPKHSTSEDAQSGKKKKKKSH